MINGKNIGKQIHDKRLSLNLTMNYVANKAGISRACLSSIENGSTNCSLSNLMSILNTLDIDMHIDSKINKKISRDRATRINTLNDKKFNDFIIMCIEEYAESVNKSSSVIYKKMSKNNVINEFKTDYEDLHGMSAAYLNQYIGSLIEK